MDEGTPDLLQQATAVLQQNDKGSYTAPAANLYPHQWLWDSCFIAIGLRHLDIARAQTEVRSLLRGQWNNGMLPNMILNSDKKNSRDNNVWRSWLNPHAPHEVHTSGITQPPMLAEAIVRIGEKLSKPERRTWYKTVFPALLSYHQWMYEERDPHDEGLVLQIHPWETGLDNTPPWMQELRDHQLPLWIRAIEKLKLDTVITPLRRDARLLHANERMTTVNALALYSAQRRLRRKNYDIERILKNSMFTIEDVTFNSIFVRANTLLLKIAKEIKQTVPEELQENIQKTEAAFAQLWDPYSRQYYSRDFSTHRLLKQPTIGTLMPLYAGCINQDRAEELVRLLENEQQYAGNYPVPSVPLYSESFEEHRYWQGPSWVNTNWLIIDGLRRYGFDAHADALTESTIDMVQRGGCREYFSPIDGSPAGADNFSWTASLTIDLLKTND